MSATGETVASTPAQRGARPQGQPRAQPLAGRTFHMMGVGGAGVSALAQLATAWGASVSGCDRSSSSYAQLVQAAGVPVALAHDPAHVQPGSELVVSSAVPADHPEILRALELGVPVRLRGELLGEFTRLLPTVVVAGAHGKSTTSAMIAHVALRCGVRASAAIGAEVPSLGGNVQVDGDSWFVVEGDESDRTLAALHAQIAVITNVERDHHHTFASDDELFELFAQWVAGLGPDSVLVAGPGPVLDRLAGHAPGSVVRFGLDEHRLSAIEQALPVPGRHNALNADAAIAAVQCMHVAGDADALAALADFRGVGRRFEPVGEAHGARVFDDYAHHPTEVAATIAAARTLAGEGRVVVVFQPHLYSRTEALAAEFADALAAADVVFLLPIYAAREAPLAGVSSELVARRLRQRAGHEATRVLALDPATGDTSTIVGQIVEGDVVIMMGAGDVTALAPRLLDGLRAAKRGAPAHGAIADVPDWVEREAPLTRFTTIGTGGNARFLAKVGDETQLQRALQWAQTRALPVAVLGLGSNSLVVDEGFDGLALRLVDELARIDIDERAATVTCGGGASLAAIVRRCRDVGLATFEFACAIPGTVGGAIKMNAGAYGGEMADVLDVARIVSADGVREAHVADLDMSYRHTNVAWHEVVSQARFQLAHGDPEQIKATVKQMQGRRSETQPRAARSFGSVFRNPASDEGSSPVPGAGALIEQAGLKGHTIGGACISPKHGNFIENLGSARTADIVALIELARERVREAFGITLVTEVHLLDRDGYRPLFPPNDDGGTA